MCIHSYHENGNFRENFIFANSVKRNVCDVKNLQLEHGLPTSVNGRVIWPFCEGFIFMKLCIPEISKFTVSSRTV